MVRNKVRALPVHQFLRAFLGAVAKRVIKSFYHALSGPTLLRSTFQWHIAGIRDAHSIVTATFLHTASVELSALATARDVSEVRNVAIQKKANVQCNA